VHHWMVQHGRAVSLGIVDNIWCKKVK